MGDKLEHICRRNDLEFIEEWVTSCKDDLMAFLSSLTWPRTYCNWNTVKRLSIGRIQLFFVHGWKRTRTSVGNFSPAMGAKNQVGTGLSYRPASLCSLDTQFQPWFLESVPRPIAGLKFSTQFILHVKIQVVRGISLRRETGGMSSKFEKAWHWHILLETSYDFFYCPVYAWVRYCNLALN